MPDQIIIQTLQKITQAILQSLTFKLIFSHAGYRHPTIVRRPGSYLSVTLYLLLLTVSTTQAQMNYTSSPSGGAIAYYGNKADENAEGEFRIATLPVVSGQNIPKDQNFSLVPPAYKMAQTNLEYYPGAEQIAISFKFDTSLVKVNDMRYSLSTDDSSVLIDWSPLPKGRWVPQVGSSTILFLDNMPCKDKLITIKLYNINNPESIITQIVNTKKLSPPRIFGYAFYSQPKPKNALPSTVRNMAVTYNGSTLDWMTIGADKEMNGLGIVMHTDVPYFFRAYLIRHIRGEVDTMDLPSNWVKVNSKYLNQLAAVQSNTNWKSLPRPIYSISIPSDVVKNEGRYIVFVATADYRREWRPSSTSPSTIISNSLSFTIQYPNSFSSTDVLLITGGIVLLGSGYFLVLKHRQRLRLRKEQQAGREARLGMQAVQSQLNPHFIFNALSGIQNLMNKQENEKANAYLTTFSNLTRMVLNDAHKDLIPIKDEIELLNNYLQMEQLRFGFSYQVLVAPDIDSQNTEVPPMLLQPFIENSVKHGIASLKEAGTIQVFIRRAQNDIFIEISDNGKGFNPSVCYPGKGLKLSKNRISLLNTIYGPVFSLDIRSRVSETMIILTIKNWLA